MRRAARSGRRRWRRRRSVRSGGSSRRGTIPTAKPFIEFRNVTKRFGDFVAVDDLSLVDLRARVLRAPRPVGLRQDHADADGRRLRAADLGPGAPRRAGPRRRAALPAADQHDVPVLRALPAHDASRQNIAFGLKQDRMPADADQGAGRGDAAAGQARRPSPSGSPTSSPAARSSAWRSPARSPRSRRCSSSTSRSARSTRSSARRRSSS